MSLRCARQKVQAFYCINKYRAKYSMILHYRISVSM